jgi:hypothetical protein
VTITHCYSRLPALIPLLLLTGCSAAVARTIPVSDDAGLRKAIASARGGDRIQLAPGSYAVLEVRDRTIDGPPVVVSGKDAKVAAIGIVGSRGWTFEGLTLGGGYYGRSRVFYVESSSDVALRNSLLHGLSVNNDPWDDTGGGVGIRFSQRVEVSGNRFRDLGMGFVAGSSSDIRFEGNSIAFVREGSNWVSVKGATIRCNRFSHMFPNWLKKEHPDAIQGWWNKDGGNENFLIEGNVILTGGPRAVQGIFLAGSYKPEGDPKNRMRNITIQDNIYYGSSQHAITVGGVENVLIKRNTVLPSPHAQQESVPVASEDGRRSRGLTPRIAVIGDVSTGLVEQNVTIMVRTPPSISPDNNVIVKRISNDGKAWAKLFPTPPVGEDPPLADFRTKGEFGARPVCGKLLPPPIDLPSGLDPSMAEWPGA